MEQDTTRDSPKRHWKQIAKKVLRAVLILSMLLLGWCFYEADKLMDPICSIWVDEESLTTEQKIRVLLEHVNIKDNLGGGVHHIPYPSIDLILKLYPNCCMSYTEAPVKLQSQVQKHDTLEGIDTILLNYPRQYVSNKRGFYQKEILRYFDFNHCY